MSLKKMLAIQRRARIAFRRLNSGARDEAVQELICHACMSYARIVEQGRAPVVRQPGAKSRRQMFYNGLTRSMLVKRLTLLLV